MAVLKESMLLFIMLMELKLLPWPLWSTYPQGTGGTDRKPAKLKMKVSNCFRTFEGAEIYARIASFVSTARKHDKNVFSELFNTFSGYNFLTW